MMRLICLRRALVALLALAAPGCAALGVVAKAIPQEPIKPKVVLAGQSVGVMVWADRGLRTAWPNVQEDLGGGLQQRIVVAKDTKAKELENLSFPFPAASFVRWQRDHPDFDAQPIATVAPRLHVQRLIYIELNDLQTRSSNAMALYRGSADASLKIFAVDEAEKLAKLLYEERINVHYPEKGTEDGRPDSTDRKMYVGTITSMADELAKRFVEHPPEDED